MQAEKLLGLLQHVVCYDSVGQPVLHRFLGYSLAHVDADVEATRMSQKQVNCMLFQG
jgi:hypothetical protein